jgi:hypothetical protein
MTANIENAIHNMNTGDGEVIAKRLTSIISNQLELTYQLAELLSTFIEDDCNCSVCVSGREILIPLGLLKPTDVISYEELAIN